MCDIPGKTSYNVMRIINFNNLQRVKLIFFSHFLVLLNFFALFCDIDFDKSSFVECIRHFRLMIEIPVAISTHPITKYRTYSAQNTPELIIKHSLWNASKGKKFYSTRIHMEKNSFWVLIKNGSYVDIFSLCNYVYPDNRHRMWKIARCFFGAPFKHQVVFNTTTGKYLLVTTFYPQQCSINCFTNATVW